MSSSYILYEYEQDPGRRSNDVAKDVYKDVSPPARVFHISVQASDLDSVHVSMRSDESSGQTNKNWTFASITSLLRLLQSVFFRLVLPVGYPSSVRSGYLQYQIYDSIQGLCSYLRNVLCAASMFEAAGVGDETATAWTAAIAWAIRDGTGLIGSLVYTYVVSDQLDAHVKEFRLFADIINDVGFTLDMIVPLLGRNSIYYWYISSSSVLCKTMCGISAGATKSSITQHFAIRGNMADLNAKESTQETIVTLIGMVGGIYAAKYLQQYEQTHNSRVATWILFVLLTMIHVWANYQGVSLLRLRTINRSRIDQCFKGFYSSAVPQLLKEVSAGRNTVFLSAKSADRHVQEMSRLLPSVIVSPQQIQEIMYERLWQMMGFLPNPRILMDIPLISLQPHFQNSVLGRVLQEAHHLSSGNIPDILSTFRYNVTIFNTKSKQNMVGITLLTDSSSHDELMAYLHAKLIVSLIETHCKQEPIQEWINLSSQIMQLLFCRPNGRTHDAPLIIAELQNKGWDVNNGRFYLGFPSCRSQLIATPVNDNKIMATKKEN